MKIRYIFQIIYLIPLLPLAAANPISTNSTGEFLVDYFENKLKSLAVDFCKKAKQLCEKRLLDKDLQEASSEDLKNYKRILQDYLEYYPYFERFEIYDPLAKIMLKVIEKKNKYPFIKPDNQILKDLLRKDFSNITKEYEKNYMEFFQLEFIPKMKEFNKEINLKNLDEYENFLLVLEDFETCEMYSKLPKSFDFFIDFNNATQSLTLKEANYDFQKFHILLYIRLYEASRNILNDSRLSEVDPNTKEIFLKDVENFIYNFENTNNIEKLSEFVNENKYFLSAFYGKKKFPRKDSQLLKSIYFQHNMEKNSSEFGDRYRELLSKLHLKLYMVTTNYPETRKKLSF